MHTDTLSTTHRVAAKTGKAATPANKRKLPTLYLAGRVRVERRKASAPTKPREPKFRLYIAMAHGPIAPCGPSTMELRELVAVTVTPTVQS